MKYNLVRLQYLSTVWHHLYRSVWLFPLTVLVTIILLSFVNISGSSVGMYDGVLNPTTKSKSSVINLEPRAIRSDEWLVNTQMTIAQEKADYPVINTNIGEGQDMSVVLDVPYKEWSVLFKPQNLIFFIAPLDFAFAFKWWFLGGLLAVSAYFFFLKLVPGRRFAAACFGTILFFTPMVQWWYQTITILPIALGFLILTLFISLHETQTTKKRLLLSASLAYLFTVFALVMYPPFQVPILLTVVFFYGSYVLYFWLEKKPSRKTLLRSLSYVSAATLVALSIVGLFLLQHQNTISTVINTAYPGKRDIPPGNYPAGAAFAGHLSVFLKSDSSAKTYKELYPVGSNQSESSNFALPTIIFLAISLILLAWYRKKIDKLTLYLLSGMSVACVVFYLNMFLPIGHTIYRFMALNLVPHNRLLIGLGFAGLILLALLVRVSSSRKLIINNSIALFMLTVVSIVSLLLTYILDQRSPGFITEPLVAIIASLFIPASLYFLCRSKLNLALLSLAILSILSGFNVNPFERRLDEITNTGFSNIIRTIGNKDPEARWVSNNLVLENYASANGVKTLSGTYSYPQLDIWRSIDPTRKSDYIYNRYAHVSFMFDDSQQKPNFKLPAGDNFMVNISPCDSFFDKYNVRYFYNTSPITSKCLQPIARVDTPLAASVFIYKKI